MSLKYKFNLKLLKWLLVLLALTFNLAFLGGTNGDVTFILGLGIGANSLAVLFFILFTIFPRTYYEITETGISYQKANGKQK